MMKLLKAEPALIIGAVQAVLTLAIAFGLHWSVEQVGAVTAVIAAVLSIVIRQSVVAPDTAADAIRSASFKTAAQLSNETAGVAGSVTSAGEQVVAKTAAGVAETVGGLVTALVPPVSVAATQQGDST